MLSAAVSPVSAVGVSDKVQFQVVYISVIDQKGQRGQMPITFMVDVPSGKSGQAICSLGPRVHNALVSHLRKEIYRLGRDGTPDGMDLNAARQQLGMELPGATIEINRRYDQSQGPRRPADAGSAADQLKKGKVTAHEPWSYLPIKECATRWNAKA